MRRAVPWRFYRSTRHLVRIPCQLVRERDFRLVGDRIANLSTSGLMVTPTEPVLTGERLIVAFELGGSWIDAEVIVARVAHGRRPGEHSRGLGLELEKIDRVSRRYVARALDALPIAPPSWRPGRRNTREALRRLIAPVS